ncbi:hypothetical protein [Rudanella lutea]|uniref:hypothetical protein n=1 Tax=Rudanella lutea TaxID=451374 RepID=UPI0003A8A4C9|nr:hypothetical protein [Rudanella lutea]
MNTLIGANRINAVATGICFMAAAVTSIAGKLLYAPVLANPDYLTVGVVEVNQVILGAVFELALVISAIGTGMRVF